MFDSQPQMAYYQEETKLVIFQTRACPTVSDAHPFYMFEEDWGKGYRKNREGRDRGMENLLSAKEKFAKLYFDRF